MAKIRKRAEEIVIAKSGKPNVVLVPLVDMRAARKAGQGEGQWRVGKNFDAPLPADIVSTFE